MTKPQHPSTADDSRPPREWTLYESATGVATHTGPTIANDEDVPVIEKSAYDRLHEQWTEKWQQALDSRDPLLAENERLAKELADEQKNSEEEWIRNERLTKELAEVRAKLEARDADETAAYMIGYSKAKDEARAEIERLAIRKPSLLEQENADLSKKIRAARVENEQLRRTFKIEENYQAEIDSQSALIERIETALCSGTVTGLQEALAEIAAFKKGEK